MARVTLYDPDGLNPYGREVAVLLHRAGHQVRLLIPTDAAWAPEDIDVRRLLAGRRGSKLRKGSQLVRGLGALILDAARGRTVIVCWSWYLVEKAVVALLGLLRARLVIVVHNPGGRGERSRASRWAEVSEQRNASKLVVHSKRLRSDLSGQRVVVCSHPPFRSYLDAHRRPAAAAAGPPVTLLVLGAVRPDKGLDLLVEIFRQVDPQVRRGLRVHLVGRDATRGAELAAGMEPFVPVMNDFAEGGVSDESLIAALTSADALLAFYPGATQSGSAILAMTAGKPVLGFDAGALPEIVRPEFLAPVGDERAAAQLVEALAAGRLQGTSNLEPLEAWESRAVREWDALVADVAKGAR